MTREQILEAVVLQVIRARNAAPIEALNILHTEVEEKLDKLSESDPLWRGKTQEEDVVITVKGKALFEVYFETTAGCSRGDNYAGAAYDVIADSYGNLNLTDMEGTIKFRSPTIIAIASHEAVKVEEEKH